MTDVAAKEKRKLNREQNREREREYGRNRARTPEQKRKKKEYETKRRAEIKGCGATCTFCDIDLLAPSITGVCGFCVIERAV